VERNNVFPAPQLGQERCMTFAKAIGVSPGSLRKGSQYFTSVERRSPVDHGTKFQFGKNCFGASVSNKGT
jgi:hypothetical protein